MTATVKIPVLAEDVNDLCIMSVEAGTTGPKGGNASHGARSVVRLENVASVSWALRVGADGVEQTIKQPTHLEIHVAGDAELRVLTEALASAVKSLRALGNGEPVEENGKIPSAF